MSYNSSLTFIIILLTCYSMLSTTPTEQLKETKSSIKSNFNKKNHKSKRAILLTALDDAVQNALNEELSQEANDLVSSLNDVFNLGLSSADSFFNTLTEEKNVDINFKSRFLSEAKKELKKYFTNIQLMFEGHDLDLESTIEALEKIDLRNFSVANELLDGYYQFLELITEIVQAIGNLFKEGGINEENGINEEDYYEEENSDIDESIIDDVGGISGNVHIGSRDINAFGNSASYIKFNQQTNENISENEKSSDIKFNSEGNTEEDKYQESTAQNNENNEENNHEDNEFINNMFSEEIDKYDDQDLSDLENGDDDTDLYEDLEFSDLIVFEVNERDFKLELGISLPNLIFLSNYDEFTIPEEYYYAYLTNLDIPSVPTEKEYESSKIGVIDINLVENDLGSNLQENKFDPIKDDLAENNNNDARFEIEQDEWETIEIEDSADADVLLIVAQKQYLDYYRFSNLLSDCQMELLKKSLMAAVLLDSEIVFDQTVAF